MSDTVNWAGREFSVHQQTADWNDVEGVYIFSVLNSQNRWVAIYVGQTDSFRNRIPRHEAWNPAVQMGATHVHATVVPQVVERDRLERSLIATYQPPLNVQLRQTYPNRA